MLESVNDRYNGIRGDPEARKDIYEELKLITGNLLQIRSSLEEEKEIAQIKKILARPLKNPIGKKWIADNK